MLSFIVLGDRDGETNKQCRGRTKKTDKYVRQKAKR